MKKATSTVAEQAGGSPRPVLFAVQGCSCPKIVISSHSEREAKMIYREYFLLSHSRPDDQFTAEVVQPKRIPREAKENVGSG